jgi:hypothetical protein
MYDHVWRIVANSRFKGLYYSISIQKIRARTKGKNKRRCNVNGAPWPRLVQPPIVSRIADMARWGYLDSAEARECAEIS